MNNEQTTEEPDVKSYTIYPKGANYQILEYTSTLSGKYTTVRVVAETHIRVEANELFKQAVTNAGILGE